MFRFRQRTLPPFLQDHHAAATPDRSQPWSVVPYTVLDIETSGLDHRRDAILAIGTVDIDARRVCLRRCWYTLVRPPDGLLVAANSIRIHGLLRDELAAAPLIDDVLPVLFERLRGRVLVVHVAAIDVAFINQVLKQHYGAKLHGDVLDTARLAMALQRTAQILNGAGGAPAPPEIALRLLAERHNLPVYAQHNALADAITTAQLFLAQATRLEQQGKRTLKKLLRVGRA